MEGLVHECRPPDPKVAVLATWPNVMDLLQDDLGSKYSCPPTTSSPENEIFCIAAAYYDSPEPSVTRTLEHTYIIAGELFDPAFPGRAEVVRRIYGIFPAFSGPGYAVRGSETGGPFSARESLRNLIVSEYLLPNRPFAELGCRCILVPPYAGRSQDLLDPRFVAEKGSAECTTVDRLRPAGDRRLSEAGGIEDWLPPVCRGHAEPRERGGGSPVARAGSAGWAGAGLRRLGGLRGDHATNSEPTHTPPPSPVGRNSGLHSGLRARSRTRRAAASRAPRTAGLGLGARGSGMRVRVRVRVR